MNVAWGKQPRRCEDLPAMTLTAKFLRRRQNCVQMTFEGPRCRHLLLKRISHTVPKLRTLAFAVVCVIIPALPHDCSRTQAQLVDSCMGNCQDVWIAFHARASGSEESISINAEGCPVIAL